MGTEVEHKLRDAEWLTEPGIGTSSNRFAFEAVSCLIPVPFPLKVELKLGSLGRC